MAPTDIYGVSLHVGDYIVYSRPQGSGSAIAIGKILRFLDEDAERVSIQPLQTTGYSYDGRYFVDSDTGEEVPYGRNIYKPNTGGWLCADGYFSPLYGGAKEHCVENNLGEAYGRWFKPSLSYVVGVLKDNIRTKYRTRPIWKYTTNILKLDAAFVESREREFIG